MDNKPNFLVVFTEHHRGDWTQLNPNLPLKTPNIKILTEKGVYFDNAVCPSPLCVPSRVCLGSGREYDNCNITNNKQCYPLDHTSFYKLLRDEAGYHTMMCGKFDFNKPLKSWGRDGKQIVGDKNYMELWGFSDGCDNGGKFDGVGGYRRGKVGPYMDYLENKGLAQQHINDYKKRTFTDYSVCPLDDEDYVDNWIGRKALELLKNSPENKPWFIQINFNGAHDPWDVTQKMRDKWKNVQFPKAVKSFRYPKKKVNGIRQNYAAQLENIDFWLGKFIEYLKEKGEYKNTIIIYSGDHGEMLADHNHQNKAYPFQPSIQVPLLFHGPNILSKGVDTNPTEMLDIAGTILDYAGLQIPGDMDTLSLKDYLESEKHPYPRKFAISGFLQWRVIIEDKYKLILGYKETFLSSLAKKFPRIHKKRIMLEPISLYDLENDPNELNNIAKNNPKIVQRLKEKLLNQIQQTPI